MKVGDLVKPKESYAAVSEQHWIGVVIDFCIREDMHHDGISKEKYAIVYWNDKFHHEEEYMHGLEIVNEKR